MMSSPKILKLAPCWMLYKLNLQLLALLYSLRCMPPIWIRLQSCPLVVLADVRAAWLCSACCSRSCTCFSRRCSLSRRSMFRRAVAADSAAAPLGSCVITHCTGAFIMRWAGEVDCCKASRAAVLQLGLQRHLLQCHAQICFVAMAYGSLLPV